MSAKLTREQTAFIRQKIAEIIMCLDDPWHTPKEKQRRRELITRAERLLEEAGASGVCPAISQSAPEKT